MSAKARKLGTVVVMMLGLVATMWPGAAAVGFQAADEQEAAAPEAETAEEQPVKLIKLYVENWKWTPNVIRVPKGTKLKIQALSYDTSRRFDLKAFKQKVLLPEGKTVTFEFVADEVGEFKWKCGRPCGNGCAKLRGKLIVE